MAEKPSAETLMMLGALAPKSQEEDKPTVDVPLTANEIQALAILSNARFQQLFAVPSDAAQQMAAIYLGVTSKLTLSLLQVHAKAEMEKYEDKQET